MRKMIIAAMAIAISYAGNAQFDASLISVGVSGNYTSYKGDFQRSTSGAKLEAGFNLGEKKKIFLSYTYGMPIKENSTVVYSNGISSQEIPSNIQYNFSTISVGMQYHFVGNDYEGFSVYAPFGASYVLVNYKEKLKGTPSAGFSPDYITEPGKESGFTINLGLGTQYNLGALTVFADGGASIPANKVNNTYVENVIPFHFSANVGVRFRFGTPERD